jgi:UDP-glucose:glycoprotein glucosyltransferase
MISETVSLESPPTLFPFIRHLIQTDKTGTTQLLGNNELLPNETYTLLEQRLDEARLLSGLGERESIRMSLSNRESSAMVETFFKIYEEQVASRDEVEVTKCENWIEYDGQQACTELEFWKLMRDSTREDISRPLLFPFDHLVSTVPSLPLAILYASPSNLGFTPLFTLLDNLAESSSKGQSRIQFALRWKPESASKGDKLVLSGYGAGLEIKKVDYIAIDDRLQKLDSEKMVDSSDLTRSTIHAVPKSDLAGEHIDI